MPVPAEGLQTYGCHFNVKKRCFTLNADERWDDKSIFKMINGIACPNAPYIVVLQSMCTASLTTITMSYYMCINKSHKNIPGAM